MTPAERFKQWIEDLSEAWKERLRGWMQSWLAKGIEDLMDDLEEPMREQVRSTLEQLRDAEATPPELKAIINEALETKSYGVLVIILISLGSMVFGMVSTQLTPLLTNLRYTFQRMAEMYRLDPATITRIWLRDKEAFEKFWEDLRDQGWNEERVAIAKELAKIIPPLPDMVRFADFSAFDPEVIERWREFYDAPGWITEPFSLIGITNEAPRDWANKYWFSHFRQPGRYELGDMYRRGLLGKPLIGQSEVGGGAAEGEAEATIKLAYKTMGYSSFWQENLLQLVREVPTRVDVRRWWDMRTIDETELRSIYQRRGYFGKDLENYVLWTKVYVAWPDLTARWSKGWITEDEVKSELTRLGMPAARVRELIETKKKAVDAEKVEEGRDYTKSEIYKGVKLEKITRGEGLELLQDLNYTLEQAEYLMDINVVVLEGSPESYEEFKALTTAYKRAIGKEEKPMPEELKKAAAEKVRLTEEVKSLQESLANEEKKLVGAEAMPAKATKKRDEIRVALHRAEAELELATQNYNKLVAQWRQGA